VRFCLLLTVALAAGAFFTKPNLDAHRKIAAALFAEGKAAAGAAPRTDKLDDFYVASKYTWFSNGRTTLECWGAYTRFLCLAPTAQ
jgi:hypothetical protein